MHPMLNIAIRAVRIAGNLIIKHYEIFNAIKVSQQGNKDIITNVNREAERLITKVIRKFYPQHVIIGEKSNSLANEKTDVQWIIVPLDGTVNFIRRFPHFAVSIAVRIKNRIEVAAVYDPMRNELFTASRGQGAQLNGYRLRSSSARDLNGTILATGFHFNQKQYANIYISLVSKLLLQCADFRCTGSVALDLAYVAAGYVDGFFEINLKPWKFAGGELLVREAGGLVTDFTGGHNYLFSGNIVAGNPRIVKLMLSTMREELSEVMKC